jgi:hypothetical protein
VSGYTANEPFACTFPGQWSVVSLPACQQQVLDRIETDLEGCEPRLRSMFAIFTRLTRDEGAPRTESLPPEGRRLRRAWPKMRLNVRAVIYVPLVLGLVTLFVLLAINSSAAPGCRAAAGPYAAGGVRVVSCQPAVGPHSRS